MLVAPKLCVQAKAGASQHPFAQSGTECFPRAPPAVGSDPCLTERRGVRMRRLLLVLAAVAFAAGALAPAAAATPPVMEEFSFTDTDVLTDVCAFPITIESTVEGTQTVFFDQEGNVTMVLFHIVEQDVFSANGNSLTGIPFTFEIQVLFDSSGNVTNVFASGLVEKVPLPDGKLFITAGRVDFAAHGFPSFLITPDVGATVNLDAFCAALAA
jgi:hypothetical protein